MFIKRRFPINSGKKGVFLALECNGNAFTKLMHSLVFNELQKMRLQGSPEILSIVPEKTVIIEKNGVERQGRFDFLIKAGDKNTGIEVLATRRI